MLVAVDFSEESFRALEFALVLAKRFDSSVQLLFVYQGKPPFSASEGKPELFLDPAVELFSEREIGERLKDEVKRRFSIDLRARDCHFRIGRPVPEICATAQKLNADLIVLATRGRTGIKHLMSGSTAEKVVGHANCPILVVREGARTPTKADAERVALRRILVPVDFSGCAREGARYASAFAERVGADLLLTHVIQPPDYVALERASEGPEPSPLVATARREAKEKMEELVHFLSRAGVTVEAKIEVGQPIEILSEATRRSDVDMVITSTHGHNALRHALIGSTAEQLVRLAHCPVLVVPSHRRPLPR